MMKDTKWLKKEIEEYLEYEGVRDARIALESVLGYIDQLDEPEVPVIPQFVADYIERAKPRHDSLYQAMEERAGEEVNEWIQAFYNSDKFARAWLDGFEVEKEKMYYIYDKSTKGYLGYNADKTRLSWYTSQFPNDVFTEQEIKSIDERYWAFAQEVTE